MHGCDFLPARPVAALWRLTRAHGRQIAQEVRSKHREIARESRRRMVWTIARNAERGKRMYLTPLPQVRAGPPFPRAFCPLAQVSLKQLGASPRRRPGCERRGAVGVARRPSGLHPSRVAQQQHALAAAAGHDARGIWRHPGSGPLPGQATVTRRAEPRAARGCKSLQTPLASQPRRARGLGRPAGKPDDRARSWPRPSLHRGAAGPGCPQLGQKTRAPMAGA